MIYVISKSTFGDYGVRDIQCNANWDCCPYSDYALIPDNLVDGILATKGYCNITLNSAGTEVKSFTAKTIPSVPEECCGENTVLSVNGVKANNEGSLTLKPSDIGAAEKINRGNFSGDLDIIGDGGVQLNSVVWVAKDAKSPFPSSWGWVETWAALSNSIVQRATQISGQTWVRTHYYKNATIGASWNDWVRIDSLNSAPSGYGLGTGGVYVSNSEVDSVLNGGFYRWDVDNDQTPFANATMLVIPRAKDTSATQVAFCNAATPGVMAFRTTTSETPGSWKFLNPYMTPGNEYLTPEFWNQGKPVYKKLVKMGKLTTEFVTVAHGASVYYVVGVEAMAIDETNKVSFPIAYAANDNVDDIGVYVDTTNVTIHNPGLLSAYSGWVIIKYVK